MNCSHMVGNQIGVWSDDEPGSADARAAMHYEKAKYSYSEVLNIFKDAIVSK